MRKFSPALLRRAVSKAIYSSNAACRFKLAGIGSAPQPSNTVLLYKLGMSQEHGASLFPSDDRGSNISTTYVPVDYLHSGRFVGRTLCLEEYATLVAHEEGGNTMS